MELPKLINNINERVVDDLEYRRNQLKRLKEKVSADLNAEFPEMKGFSARNLKYMQRFAKL